MGKTTVEAPKPDPNIANAAMMQGQLGREWLDVSKDQFAKQEERLAGQDVQLQRIIDADLKTQDQSNKWAIEDRNKYNAWAETDRAVGRGTMEYADGLANAAQRNGEMYEQVFGGEAQRQSGFGQEEMARYKSTFRPVQDKLAADAMGWDSAERMESEAGKARADVIGSADLQQQAAQRQMASMGIDPRSGRYAGVTRAGDVNTALAAAGAQNSTRDNVRNQAQMLRQGAAQVGQQVISNGQTANGISMQATSAGQAARLAGQATALQAKNMGLAAAGIGNTTASMGNSSAYAGLGLGLNAGGAATGVIQSGNAGQMANTAALGQGFSGAMGGYGGQASGLNSLYGNQLQGFQISQQASNNKASGIGSLLGTVGGLALKAAPLMMSSKEYKTDKQPVSGALDAVGSMPVEKWKYKDGIADGKYHIGPYAEDFKKATGRGDGKSIPVVDAIGVTMKAVQELNGKVDALARGKGR